MPGCYIRVLTPSGLEDAAYTATSLADAVQYEPEGVYTITNTVDTFKVLKLDAHLDRMEDSARREGIALIFDRVRLRATLRQMIGDSGFGDVRFRITVPRQQPDHFYLSLEPFSPPLPSVYEQGVRCATVVGMARRNPAAKTNDWARDRHSAPLPPGIYEGLLVGEAGEILEGFSSNFYAVFDGELRTAGDGVLPGISRQIIFEVAPRLIKIHTEAITLADVPLIAEAFITSSSRGVVPVVEIDEIAIGSGSPGALTQAIRREYMRWVSEHLETL